MFAAARGERWGRFGALFSLADLLTSSTVTALAVQQLNTGNVRWTVAVTAFMVVLLLVTGAAFQRGGATVVALFASAMQGVFWWFAPWAARTYADFVGLPMREHIRVIPSTPALVPFCLVAVGIILDLLLRRASGPARLLPALAGGVGGAIIAALAPVQRVVIYDARLGPASIIVATTIAGAAFGALGGFLGRRFGLMLRLAAPSTELRA
ncbi:hypothetical protein [Nocardia crassostreae]|uniref:hypothetical protein n=1 Tax=Nocardia crassostreae TaxID=53428 RepID=UPI000AF5129E|nr:hypothetical protein [Nocardia crassostreae]